MLLWAILAGPIGVAIGVMATLLVLARRARMSATATQDDRMTLERERIEARSRETALADRLAASDSRAMNIEARHEQTRKELSIIQQDNARLESVLTNEREKLVAERTLLSEMQTRLRESFESLSAQALSTNNQRFLELAEQSMRRAASESNASLEQRKTEIDGMLKPMRETLGAYQTRLAEVEAARNDSYGKIREELGKVSESYEEVRRQTKDLTVALRSSSARGRWGEIALRRICEMAGLAEHSSFYSQSTTQTEDGNLRPDAVVRMPGDRCVVIDAKFSGDAFFEADKAVDDATRKTHLAHHARLVRSRARELSSKKYKDNVEHAADFVVMFIPGDVFLYAAVENDPQLIEDALGLGVLIASPSVLLGLLKVVEQGWRHSKMLDEHKKIADLGKLFYERVAVLSDHFAKLGAAIRSTTSAYNDTLGSLESRVMPTAKTMHTMGVKSDAKLKALSAIDEPVRSISPNWANIPRELTDSADPAA